jgi:hypothetical protein
MVMVLQELSTPEHALLTPVTVISTQECDIALQYFLYHFKVGITT